MVSVTREEAWVVFISPMLLCVSDILLDEHLLILLEILLPSIIFLIHLFFPTYKFPQCFPNPFYTELILAHNSFLVEQYNTHDDD